MKKLKKIMSQPGFKTVQLLNFFTILKWIAYFGMILAFVPTSLGAYVLTVAGSSHALMYRMYNLLVPYFLFPLFGILFAFLVGVFLTKKYYRILSKGFAYLAIVALGVNLVSHTTTWTIWNAYANTCMLLFIFFVIGFFGSEVTRSYLPASVLVKTPAEHVDLKLVSVHYSWLSWEQGGYDFINYTYAQVESLKKEETDGKGRSWEKKN